MRVLIINGMQAVRIDQMVLVLRIFTLIRVYQVANKLLNFCITKSILPWK